MVASSNNLVQTRTHSSRACDQCSTQKTRCISRAIPRITVQRGILDDNQSSCQRCYSRGLTCTFARTILRRGPPTKRRRRGSISFGLTNGSESTTSTRGTENQVLSVQHISDEDSFLATESLSPPNSGRVRSHLPASRTGLCYEAQQLFDCFPSIWKAVEYDFINLVYPIVPVIHIPTFKSDLDSNKQVCSPSFACLRLSMLAALIGVVPDRFLCYANLDVEFRRKFDSRTHVVEVAEGLFNKTKGADFYDVPSLRSWAIVKLFGLAYAYLRMSTRSQVYGFLSYMLALKLDVHLIKTYTGLDCIEAQLRKRALWISLTGLVHKRIFNQERDLWTSDAARFADLDELFPAEVDDEFITSTITGTQPIGTVSLMTAFIAEKKILACLISVGIGSTLPRFVSTSSPGGAEYPVGQCDCGRYSVARSKVGIFVDCLNKLKYLLDDLPSPLNALYDSGADTSKKCLSKEGLFIQSANLTVTYYWAQNFLIECLLQATPKQQRGSTDEYVPRTDEYSLWERRDELCRALLGTLNGISVPHLRANGTIMVHKIRQIATDLLDCPGTSEMFVPLSRRAQQHVKDFARLLAQLEDQ